MSESYLLALDQGTSSSRAVLVSSNGESVASAQVPLAIHYPDDGWVEQDASAIWQSQLEAMALLEQRLSPGQRAAVRACGITNQRETTTLWRRSTGQPFGPSLVWQDRRTASICGDWKRQAAADQWQRQTGLVLDPYFSASKIAWMLQAYPEARQALAGDDLCFGTVDSWLLWQLTRGAQHATDISNASRTLLLDLEQLCWLPEAVERVGLSLKALPDLRPTRSSFGVIAEGLPFAGVPITAMLGDQQAASYGQFCRQPGQAKCTYGTGAFLVVNCGQQPQRAAGGLLSTVGWSNADGSTTYCIEGSLFNAGTVIQWLRDGLGIIRESAEVDGLASKVASAGELMLVPAFTGWGSPHWDPNARGLLIGMTRDTGAPQIARAALEGIALAVTGLLRGAAEALGAPLRTIAVDGGAAASAVLLQAQADSAGVEVVRPANLESTALGVALMAGEAVGVVDDLEAIASSVRASSTQVSPQQTEAQRERWLRRWDQAVERCLEWHGDATV
ncbi:MAG: glycerol kinase GlpK [Synechococcaceae bacterium WB7_3xG_012]|uniref:FGGY family carbohydrate kinase n=1 Tax=Synechococcaceae TaxID=1890426 RepID=UPI001FF8C2D7|nr:glycerol kinase GlpK [Synechococcus sp. NB0720_010]NCV91575.1 glycerol kinase GlpK [Synechococcaceae bacterium WB7_3xG_012]UPH90508.1 glycerol kinase GlpK [Synechococcus sp. NB0720_010]